MKYKFNEKALMKFTYGKVLDLTKDYVNELIDQKEIKMNSDPLSSLMAALTVVYDTLGKTEKDIPKERSEEILRKMYNDFGTINFEDNENEN
jgi:hypothetical protein